MSVPAREDRVSENEWLLHLAAQIRLGVTLTPDDLTKLAQALPAIMRELQDVWIRVAVLENSIDLARERAQR